MIDIESDVYAIVSAALKAEFPGVWTSGEDTDLPARFPTVTIVQQDNAVREDRRTLVVENGVDLMFEVNAYSNKVGYGKSEAKQLMAAADREMAKLNFVRTLLTPTPNFQDKSIFKLTARYKAGVDKELWLY